MRCWILTDYSKELGANIASKSKTDIGGVLGILPEGCELGRLWFQRSQVQYSPKTRGDVRSPVDSHRIL